MTSLELSRNGFTGTIDLTALPSTFRSLFFSQAGLTGPIDLSALPASLETLDLSFNQLEGAVDFTDLPNDGNFADLILNSNNFVGSVDLGQLPGSTWTVDLSHNFFSGFLNLAALPGGVGYAQFSSNNFTGTPDLSVLSIGPYFQFEGQITLDNNDFTGTVSINASRWTSRLYDTINLTGNALFAVWVSSSGGQNIPPIYVDPSVRVYQTSNATAPLRAGLFTSSASKHSLRLFPSGTATLDFCSVTIPSGSFQVFSDGTNYVADSGVIAAALAPCLPTTFGTPQYFLKPTTGTLLLVTNGLKNITFTRRSG